jgi:hypothetical protein
LREPASQLTVEVAALCQSKVVDEHVVDALDSPEPRALERAREHEMHVDMPSGQAIDAREPDLHEEGHPGLGRRELEGAAARDERDETRVELTSVWRRSLEEFLDRVVAAGVGTVPHDELGAATRTLPERRAHEVTP